MNAGLHRHRDIPSPLQAGAIWLSAGLLMLLATSVVWMASAAVMVATGTDPKVLTDPDRSPFLTHPTWLALGSLPAQTTLLIVLVLWLWLLKPDLRKVLPMRWPTPGQLVGAVLVVYGLAPAAGAIAELVHQLPFIEADFTTWKAVATVSKRANVPQLLLLVFALAIVPAVAEEAMFRGLITAPFLRASKVVAILVPSVMFGIFHVGPVEIAGTIILGIGFALARVYTASLVPAAIAHCLNNMTVIFYARHTTGEVPQASLSPWPIAVGLLLFGLGWLLLIRTQHSTVSLDF